MAFKKGKTMTDSNNNNDMFEDFDAMFNENDDVFDGLDDCETWDRLPFFQPNERYLLTVDAVKFVKSSQSNDRFYIINFTIDESTCDELPAGTRASHVIKCSSIPKERMYGPMNFKQFLSGVTGFPASRKDVPWSKIGKAAIAEGKLNGMKVRLQTNLNQKGTFTNHTYSHVE